VLSEEKYKDDFIKKFIKNRYTLCVEIKSSENNWLLKKSDIPFGPFNKDKKEFKGSCERCSENRKLYVTCKCKQVIIYT